MTVEEIDPITPEMILGPSSDPPSPRSPGLHLSQIYWDLAKSAGLLGENDFTEEELAFYKAGGFLWEHCFKLALLEAFADASVFRPGEFTRDGIIGSPDGLRLEPFRLVELKCTWQSSRKLDQLEKYRWVWLAQIKSYCWMTGANQCELHVFCVCGDWRPPVPATRSFLLEWSDRELQENWAMIVNHARRRKWL